MDNADKGRLILQGLKKFQKKLKKNFLKRFPDLNMTSSQGMVIGILMRHGDMKISDLSKKMYLSNSTVSGIIDRLEKNKIVDRTRSKEDRRKVIISINEEFHKKSKERFKALDEHFAKTIGQASPEELDKILEAISILERLMSSEQAENENNQEKHDIC